MRKRYLSPFALLVTLTGSGCGGGSDSKPKPPDTVEDTTVEIYSWWTAGGEAEALAHLINLYREAYPGQDVVNSTSSEAQAAFDEMNQRLAEGDPPDSWQAILGNNLLSYTRFVPADADPETTKPVNVTEDLTDLYASEGWSDKFPPSVLAAMKDGAGTYAVPLSVGRINEIYYNKAIFQKYDLSPPETAEDLFTIGAALEGKVDADGDPIIPLVIASGYEDSAWPARFVFDAILMARPGGIQFRQDYYAGKKAPDDAMYVEAAKDFTSLLVQYTNVNTDLAPDSEHQALHLTWEGAADLVHSGRAAMFLHGSWVKGYLESKGDIGGTEFGVVQFPRKAFVYAGDSFVVSKDAPHKAAALDFLRLMGSPDAQSSFNKIKGALPARTDADTSDYDTIGRQSAEDFRDPTVTLLPASWDYPPLEYWACWDDAVLDVVEHQDPDAYVSFCAAEYELLAPHGADAGEVPGQVLQEVNREEVNREKGR